MLNIPWIITVNHRFS